MARTRLTGTKVIAEGNSGPIKQVWEAHGAALGFFESRIRNELMRDSVVDGGNYWSVAFLHLRFDSNYAVKLGYDVSWWYIGHKKKMAARGIIEFADHPLVYTGVLKAAAIKGVTVRATATANKQTLYIKIPIPPHGGKVGKNGKKQFGIAKMVGKILRALPAWEVKRVAETIERSLVRRLQGKMEEPLGARPNPGTPRPRPEGVKRERVRSTARGRAA